MTLHSFYLADAFIQSDNITKRIVMRVSIYWNVLLFGPVGVVCVCEWQYIDSITLYYQDMAVISYLHTI